MSRVRSKARSWALSALFAWESRVGRESLGPFVGRFISERRVAPERVPYMVTLLDTVAAHLPEIDERVQAALLNWRLERLSAIDRNVLRLGAAELLYLPDVPPRVAIQEAILLAEKYGTAQSPRFVNGVLDALMRGAPAAGEAP